MRTRVAITFLLMTIVALAQVSRTSGALAVLVTDESGAVIPAATIQVVNKENGQSRSAVTENGGRALITDVPAGTYAVRVTASGFTAAELRDLQIQLGRQTLITVRLKPQTTQQQITVTAAGPSTIDPGETSTTTTIDTERIEESPVVTRNYLDFVLLAPGLAVSQQQQRASTGGNVLEDSGFTFAGQRPRSNALYIDGVENNDEYTGATRTELSLELVREFQVVNNGVAAEAGGGAGGSINVITRSGVNTFHGDSFIFLQNGALNAREPFLNETEKPDSSKYRSGLALGGPVVKDKTFFYVAAEQENKSDDSSSAIGSVPASEIDQVLSSGAFLGLPVRQLNPGFSRARRAETEASGRIDHQFSNTSATLRYSFNNNRESGDAFNAGALNDASIRGSSFTEDHTLASGITTVTSPSLVNDAHFQISTRRGVLRSNQQLGPEIDIVGIARFGRPYQGNLTRYENHFEGTDAVTVSTKHHLFKFGADVDYIHESLRSVDGEGGLYTFLSIADFANARPYQFRQRFGLPSVGLGVTKTAGFIQDHWTALPRLTVDLGLRYDYEHLPERFNADLNNFAPRIGIAYSPATTWVLRGGFGVFYDRYPLASLSRTLLNDGVSAYEQIFDLDQAAAVFQSTSGGSLSAPVGSSRSIYNAEPTLQTSYSEQANAGVEHLIWKNTTLTATYLFSRGLHLSRTRNVNLGFPVTLTAANAPPLGIPFPVPQQLGRLVFPATPVMGVRDVFQLENRASSAYHGGFLSLRSKLSSDFDLAATYTFSKCTDDASDFTEQPENPLLLRPERAPCSFDQRHRFVLSGLFELGEEERDATSWSSVFRHIEIAPILSAGSSRPLNSITGFDANFSHTFPISSRPLGIGRNSSRTGTQFSADLRVLKYFKLGEHGKLDVVAEGFNLLNHPNVLARQNQFGPNLSPSTDFLRPILGATPRQLEFSLDYEF